MNYHLAVTDFFRAHWWYCKSWKTGRWYDASDNNQAWLYLGRDFRVNVQEVEEARTQTLKEPGEDEEEAKLAIYYFGIALTFKTLVNHL